MLKKHVGTVHIKPSGQQSQEMRVRYACDECNLKSTSKESLITHKKSHHKTKAVTSKRRQCNLCEKRFNKEITFNQHMKKDHEGIQQYEVQ